jgi:hypothetical protein
MLDGETERLGAAAYKAISNKKLDFNAIILRQFQKKFCKKFCKKFEEMVKN